MLIYISFLVKMRRLRQAKEEADQEIAQYRSHLEAEYQNSISQVCFCLYIYIYISNFFEVLKIEYIYMFLQNIGNSDSTLKKLEMETEKQIQELKEKFSKVSEDVVALLTKYITKV